MNISIIGSGYVGLVAAICLAKLGNEVILIDTDEDRINSIANKVSPIYEVGLDAILKQVDIRATSNHQLMIDSELILICVGTPTNLDGSASLEFVVTVASQIASVLKEKDGYCVIGVKSTVVPGTTRDTIIPILESSGKRAGVDFGVCAIPEFLREGMAIYDFMNPARVIIGEFDKRSGDVISNLYNDFKAPIMRTDLITAEMIKYASNTFLVTKISFINEIGNICKRLGINAYEVAKGMGFDDRIGNKYLNPGIGFGGSCLPKDIRALIAKAKQIGYEPRILEEVLRLNEEQPKNLINLLKKHLTSIKGRNIGILGLSFKPGTDDIRESRAIDVIQALLQEGAKVKAYDPLAMGKFRKLFPVVKYTHAQEVTECDAILILTEWPEFNELDYKGKLVIDGRLIPKAKEARIYEGICWEQKHNTV